jgi:L-histidine Nalpha-methyltransferase
MLDNPPPPPRLPEVLPTFSGLSTGPKTRETMDSFAPIPFGPEDLRYSLSHALARQQSTILHIGRPVNPQVDFAAAVAAGLRAHPRQIPCRFLYDQAGSLLYEQICRQPEYYPTRTEAAILARHAPVIAEHTGPVTMLELGAGSSAKTGLLLDAYLRAGTCPCYVPIDVSASALRLGHAELTRAFPQVTTIGLHGCYEDALPLLQAASPAMVLFLGSTIGNFGSTDAGSFLANLAACMADGDFFLLGVDLVKDARQLEAAYNDAAGVTAAFTRNLFARMNRELGTAIDLLAVQHQARYVVERQRIEIHARFDRAQQIDLAPVRESFQVAAGEQIQTEISRKFRLEEISPWLSAFGLTTREIFSDERGWFALALLQKTGRTASERSG